ncbi:MAG: rhodanese-like domain-containing protein [Betaproteobacteria bacterium]|nr:rhodanese-like domain-containing protein [Betaproteobacteria bacterium]
MSVLAFLEKNWMLVAVAFVSGAMLLWPLVQRRFSQVKDLGTLGATRLLNQDALLLDVRETNEFEQGRLPERASHPAVAARRAHRRGEGQHDLPVIVYCASGRRSRMAGATLAKAGFKDIYHLTGGIAAWRGAGLPVEK